MSKDFPAHRLNAAAELAASYDPALIPQDVSAALAEWLHYEAETLAGDPSDYCGERLDGEEECDCWFCGSIDRALALADLLLEKP